jgi:hypothetical protein
MPNFRWLYDGAQIALTLRSDYQRMQREARLHLADLLSAGSSDGLARAADLYSQAMLPRRLSRPTLPC